ncbi:hypothetical protein BTUL_0001g01130 [Botrytis tulipae]|uniref:Aminotransferase class I/classII large domain-containing protein n=1 Tax=Botrytis tulipae TaxID=87230 RepID=A0A4Z1F5U5_9HELO|nr:hypothetical protein BTUL_0001g01130 [Botrytis tulipae]
MPSVIFSRWMASQKSRAHTMRGAPVFYRNLEEALDVRRKDHGLYTLVKNTWAEGTTVDFCSNDSLSFGASGRLREAFEEELAQNPDAQIGAGGSRLMDGNYDYIEKVEQEIAEYHGAEAALIVGSGCDGNYAIFEGIPRPGDAIIYDQLVHASIMDGMSRSLASTKVSFAHNDVDAFREALISVWDAQPLIRQGKKCVLIVVESFYSMEGDMSPLKELVQAAKEIFPGGNAQFIVDEAHSMGVVGERGLGCVNALELDSEIAIKTHTFNKAFGSIGVFTAAPAFHQVAAIRAGYALMPQLQTKAGRENIQYLVKRLFTKITSHPIWEEASDRNIISIPVLEDWEERDFQTQLVPLWTRERYGHWLTFHLDARNYSAFPVKYPVVPKGGARLRVVIHANHTEEQIDGLVAAVCEWAEEMVQIETGTGGRGKVPWAAQQVYALTEEEGVNRVGDESAAKAN